MSRPKFDSHALRELKRLGVSDSQIAELERTLIYIRAFIGRRPKRKETQDLLREIERLALQLGRKLDGLVTQPEPEYGYAYTLFEPHYWDNPARQNDDGQSASHHLGPRLAAVANAAKLACADIPPGQARQSVADHRAIFRIKEALLNGWVIDNPPAEGQGFHRQYPDCWRVGKGSPFVDVAGICFKAVGGNDNPIRAIEACMAIKRKEWNELYAALEEGIATEAPKN